MPLISAAAVSFIENNSISLRTKKRYASTNFGFILWLYEHHPDKLHPAIREELAAVPPNISSAQQMRDLRAIVNRWLDNMQRTSPERCPVDMTQVSYELVASYMTSKKKDDDKYLSRGTYIGIRSSIIYLFTMSNLSPPPEFRDRMTTLLKGLKRMIVEQRVSAGETPEEGKDAMSFACLKLLCQKFFQGDKDEYHFAHLFLLLEWNLIARSNSVANLHINDFEFEGDSLLVYLKKTKTDQEGNDSRTPYHCYFNTVDPFLNLGLAIGLYLLSNPGILSNPKCKLFPSEYQYNRYASILNKVIEKHQEEFARIGVKPGTIGTHSARKGAATYAASGCTICPSMSSICNRAGWKLGGTRDKYIKYEAAGDQFLGRTLCGLNSLTKEFSLSPPFFNMDEDELSGVDRLLMSFVADGSVMIAPTFEVLRMCFACVVYHNQFLQDHLHTINRFRSHPSMAHLPQVTIVFFVFGFLHTNILHRLTLFSTMA